MKPKIALILSAGLFLAAVVSLLTLPACVSTTSVTANPDGTFATNTVSTLDTNRIDRIAKQAAVDGTVNLLGQHPEWRSYFVQAEADLNILANSPSVSLNDILAIVQRLPVKELKGNTAQLSFEGATLLISALDVPQLPVEANADLQSLARAISDGVAAGLAESPAPTPAPAPVAATNAPAK